MRCTSAEFTIISAGKRGVSRRSCCDSVISHVSATVSGYHSFFLSLCSRRAFDKAYDTWHFGILFNDFNLLPPGAARIWISAGGQRVLNRRDVLAGRSVLLRLHMYWQPLVQQTAEVGQKCCQRQDLKPQISGASLREIHEQFCICVCNGGYGRQLAIIDHGRVEACISKSGFPYATFPNTKHFKLERFPLSHYTPQKYPYFPSSYILQTLTQQQEPRWTARHHQPWPS